MSTMTSKSTGRQALELGLVVAALAMLHPAWTYGSTLSLPHVFSSSEPIDADKLNKNFAAVKVSVDDNATRIDTVRPKIGLTGLSRVPRGGNSNSWEHGKTFLVAARDMQPATVVSGQPFTGILRLQTADSSQGGDAPGPPIAGGVLSLDLEWAFVAGAGPGLTATSTSASAIEVIVEEGKSGDISVAFSGVVPAAPKTAGGYSTTHLQYVVLKVNSNTTAEGQGLVCVDMQIDSN